MLTEGLSKAKEGGDEDYRLFFQAELLGCEQVGPKDFAKQGQLVEEAMRWANNQGFSGDDFLIRCRGVYLSVAGAWMRRSRGLTRPWK